MLSGYLNRGATLERATGTDDRGQAVLVPARAVKCRKQKRTRIAMNNSHAVRVPETVYYLTVAVTEGDKLDGKVVLSVNEWAGLDGKILGYKAVV